MYSAFRRFHKPGDSFIYTDSVAVFDTIEGATNFMNSETEHKGSVYNHLDTYVVEFELNKVYKNIENNAIIMKKTFNEI